MLLDLGRNDVGRVAMLNQEGRNAPAQRRKGPHVRVTASFFVERYRRVMHLVSNVEGDAPEGLDPVDVLMAALPAGTLSGAPKVRAMEIIDELEREKRGVAYAGAVGYFGADGSVDTCIVLRTALVKDGAVYVQAGGGVVADSDPVAEYEETLAKARAIREAATEAWRFA
jgi:anthranilate synthase component 1